MNIETDHQIHNLEILLKLLNSFEDFVNPVSLRRLDECHTKLINGFELNKKQQKEMFKLMDISFDEVIDNVKGKLKEVA